MSNQMSNQSSATSTDTTGATSTKTASVWPKLTEHWQNLADTKSVLALLAWEQSTTLPQQAAAGRARQYSLVQGWKHEQASNAEYGRWLEDAHQQDDLSETQQRTLAIASKEYDEAARLPHSFVTEKAQHFNECYEVWRHARPTGDFAKVVPYIEKTLDLSRQMAAYFPEYSDPMDYFIQESDEGMNSTQVDQVFAELKTALVPLVQEVLEAEQPRCDFLFREYDAQTQLAFGEQVARDYGYDFTRGRQDLTPHPFCIRLGSADVRITTRVKTDDLTEALYSSLHEVGHALYEQGVADVYLDTPLGDGCSAGVHESQSRLWENLVGRSRAFWSAYFGDFRDTFPAQLADVSAEEMYRATNRVSRSLIRTDADELTYNLHVIIRYELERQLLAGTLAVSDLAEAWHAAYQQNLGVRAPNDIDGVLQDVHWFNGTIGGAFQGYTLGNIMSAQFYAAAQQALPELDVQISRKEFGPLHGWLRENIYQHGKRYTPNELIERATGQTLSVKPYVSYLEQKYRNL